MPQITDQILSIYLPDLGREIRNIENYSLDSSYMTSADAFSFTTFDRDLSKIRNLELQPVELRINGNLQMYGRIEITEIGGGNGLSLRCSGRDYMADLIECNVDPALVLNEKMTMADAVKSTARTVGIDNVSFDAARWRNIRVGKPVETPIGTRTFEQAPLKNYKPNPGEGIFEFLSRLCVRFGCTLQPTLESNNVLLGAPDYLQEASYFVNRSILNPTSSANNVISASIRRDYTKFPTVVLVSGKTGGAAAQRTTTAATSTESGIIPLLIGTGKSWFGAGPPAAAPAPGASAASGDQTGTTVPSNIQKTIFALLPPGVLAFTQRILPKQVDLPQGLYRLLYLRDTLSKDTDQTMNTAARIAAERLKDCLQYEVTFRGFQDPTTGRTFTSDTVIEIADEICDVYGRLWVERVSFSYEPGTGPQTRLICWLPGSFGIGAKGQ